MKKNSYEMHPKCKTQRKSAGPDKIPNSNFGQVSDVMETECETPQGSRFGPLLFIICLNDFEHCLKHSRANR